MYSRAVHIEVVPTMDTSSFTNALRRFYAVRGVCKQIRSDNGTNFVGARGQMESAICMDSLKEAAESHGTEWLMNPPGASSYGGSWERAIGSVRKILDVSLIKLGESHFSRDELHTLLQECCAIINNTPLYEISDYPDDPLPITPAHLLTHKDSPNPRPPESYTQSDILSYGKKRWRRIQVIAVDFWSKRHPNYIQNFKIAKTGINIGPT